MSETGSVKFHCEHLVVDLPPFRAFAELQTCRQTLRSLGVLGVDDNGVGFGNVSVRDLSGGFYITGSGTGGLAVLTEANYAHVTAWNFARNWLRCAGQTVASAESLTHAAIYDCDENVGAIIHGHHAELWRRLRAEGAPLTPATIEYGTPEMAGAVDRLFAESNVRARKIFVMSGHPDGFVVFGRNLAEALEILTHLLRGSG